VAADPLDIVTLTEARTFLNFDDDSSSDDDDELQGFITALTPVVEAEVGPVVSRETSDIIYPTGGAVPLPQWPVVSLTSGVLLHDDSVVDVAGMTADKSMLFMTDGSSLPFEPWTLTYVVGRESIPANIRQGALEILGLAWETQRGEGDLPAFLIPYRAAAWLRPTPALPGFA
jgi:hypothetical protein